MTPRYRDSCSDIPGLVSAYHSSCVDNRALQLRTNHVELQVLLTHTHSPLALSLTGNSNSTNQMTSL
jgi:hypothetical protein